MNGAKFNIDDMQLLFSRYNKGKDNKMRYSDFTDAMMPFDEHY